MKSIMVLAIVMSGLLFSCGGEQTENEQPEEGKIIVATKNMEKEQEICVYFLKVEMH